VPEREKMVGMSRNPSRTETDWQLPPEVSEPEPPRERRSWGKVSHSDRYRRQRTDLLRAAVRLAGRKGYEGTRVADIVAEAGLSKSTFYEHFASKEECFVELNRRTGAEMLRTAVSTAETALDRGAYTCLYEVIRAFVGYPDRNPRLAEVLRASLNDSRPTVGANRDENLRGTIQFFVTLARRLGSPYADDELELTATVLVRGVTDILADLRRDRSTLDDRLRAVARLGCRALGLDGAERLPQKGDG
jgi:AcrR family transcriptional regulator